MLGLPALVCASVSMSRLSAAMPKLSATILGWSIAILKLSTAMPGSFVAMLKLSAIILESSTTVFGMFAPTFAFVSIPRLSILILLSTPTSMSVFLPGLSTSVSLSAFAPLHRLSSLTTSPCALSSRSSSLPFSTLSLSKTPMCRKTKTR